MLTVEDVVKRVDKIREEVSDVEVAHGLEDDLYLAVLQEISRGTPYSMELARAALETQEIIVRRWYA